MPIRTLGRDLVALLPVAADAFRPQIGQKRPRLENAGTMYQELARSSARHVDDLVDMRNPLLLRLGCRLDGLAGLAHGADSR